MTGNGLKGKGKGAVQVGQTTLLTSFFKAKVIETVVVLDDEDEDGGGVEGGIN